MTEINQIYKCNVCGNIVQVIHAGANSLVCCGQPMELQTENTVDASLEKHVPIIEKTANGVKIKVGAVPHPMEEKHYIEWIEATSEEGDIDKIFLKPGMKPEAKFRFKVKSARAYCNIHGLWKSI